MRREHHRQGIASRVDQSILIRQTHSGEAFSDRTQTDTLSRHTLLPFDIGSANDQCQSDQSDIRNCIVFNDRLEGAPGATVVEFYSVNPGCVERNGAFLLRLLN
jgi:hypothetical protein